MVGTKEIYRFKYRWIVLATIVVLMTAATACGSNDSSAKEQPKNANQSVSITDSVDDSTDDVAAVEVDPVAKVHEGPNVVLADPDGADTDTLEIAKLMDTVVGAMNVEDWGGTIADCDFTRTEITADKAQSMAEFWYAGRVEWPGLNYRNMTVQTFKDDTALSKADEYQNDVLLAERIQHSWYRSDGVWYSTKFCIIPPGL